jgi:hypothetical protein
MKKQHPIYKARGNEILDQTGKQIALILASGCTKKLAGEFAMHAAQQMNRKNASEAWARENK